MISLPNIHRLSICVTIWNGITIIATNISEKASETIKKFCTVRNGRNVKTDKITRIFPHIHKIIIVERTNAIGIAFTVDIGRIADDDEDSVIVVVLSKLIKLVDEGDIIDILKLIDDIKYQSNILNG